MCGIIGYISVNNNFNAQEAHDVLRNGLVLCQSRGRDATGYALIRGTELYYCKSPMPAEKFVKMPAFKKTIGTDIITCHCRNATHGKNTDNNNNHPIMSDSGIAVEHNGVISNYEETKRKYPTLFKYSVDSEMILRLIEGGLAKNQSMTDAIIEACKEIQGSATFSVLRQDEPDTLYLVKHQNPLNLLYSEQLGVVFYSSQKDFIRPFLNNTKHFGIFNSGCYEYTLDDDTLVVIKRVTVDGKATLEIKEHKLEFKTYFSYWKERGDYEYEYSGGAYKRIGYDTESYKYLAKPLTNKQQILFPDDTCKQSKKWLKKKRLADNNLTLLWDKNQKIHYFISTLEVLSNGNKCKANEFSHVFKGENKRIILFNSDLKEYYALNLHHVDDVTIETAKAFIKERLNKLAENQGGDNARGETEPEPNTTGTEPTGTAEPNTTGTEPATSPCVGCNGYDTGECDDCIKTGGSN